MSRFYQANDIEQWAKKLEKPAILSDSTTLYGSVSGAWFVKPCRSPRSYVITLGQFGISYIITILCFAHDHYYLALPRSFNDINVVTVGCPHTRGGEPFT
jgi:hypothetical protein